MKTIGGKAGELFILGAHIGRLRIRAGLTQREMAKQIGVTRLAVSGWERGKRAPSILDMIRIARVVRVAPSILFSILDGFRPPRTEAKEPDSPEARTWHSRPRPPRKDFEAQRIAREAKKKPIP